MNGPWRVLILDASPDDPKWLLATISLSSDVRAAVMRGRRYQDWESVCGWIREQVGDEVSLIPISGVCWRIDQR